MPRLILIRHLPTQYNRQGLLQGKRDIPILPPSTAELARIDKNRRELTKTGHFDLVLTSSLCRTIMTAALYGFDNIPAEPLLNELDFGAFEGRPRREMISLMGPAWEEDPRGLEFGESIADLEKRIRSFLTSYGRYHRILLFGHGSWIRALCSLERHGDLRGMNRITLANNSLVDLETAPPRD